MRIIVQVCSGPLQGHRYAIATGQQMMFGRTAESDIAFPDDDRMSSRHFQLVVDQIDCRIRDLASTNGTSVNGQAITLAVLKPGDRIQAGNTELTLISEGAENRPAPQDANPAAATTAPSAETTARTTVGHRPGRITASSVSAEPQDRVPAATKPSSSVPPSTVPSGAAASGHAAASVAASATVTSGATSPERPLAVSTPASQPKLQVSVLEGAFLVHPCKSNVHCYRGSANGSLPQAIAARFSQQHATVVSVDLSKVDAQFQQLAEPKAPLHDWLPPEVQAESPHVLLSQPEQIGDFSVIADGWGKDAVVTIYAPQNEPVPLEQIRRCAGAYCRPSLVRPSLADTTIDQVGDFMKGIDAVLVEDEDPQWWVLYSPHDLRETLIGMGLNETTTTPTAG